MIQKKVLAYLEKNRVAYDLVDHRKIFTAYDRAQTLHTDLKQIAKTLLVQADKVFVLVVVPAYYRLDLKKLKKALGAKSVSIPKEKVLGKVLNVKMGGITPFGTFHGLETWVDKSLLKTTKALFNAGSFTQSLRLKVKDFAKLEQAHLASFVVSGGYKLQSPIKKPVRRSVAKKKKKSVRKTKKKSRSTGRRAHKR